MADPTTTNKFLILLGDGASPEVFAHPCGANARSVTLKNNTGEEVLLDCTDPTGTVAAVTRWTESQDTTIQVSGRVATESWASWKAWAESGAVKNIQVHLDIPLANGGGYWTLPAILADFEIGAEGTATATFSASIVGAGSRSWTAASP